MWVGRCSYIRRLDSPYDFGGAIESVRVPGCKDYWLGIGRYSAELWVVSHPAALIVDTMPVRNIHGKPITYVWAYKNLPRPNEWQPSMEAFPRHGIDAESYFAGFKTDATCASASIRVSQYRAAFGSGVMDRLPAKGLHCAWCALAEATLPAASENTAALAAFLKDLRGSVNASWCSESG